MTVSVRRESRDSLDPELPTLLPGLLRIDRDDGDGRADVRRTARDWLVDTLGFLVAAAIGLMAYDTAMLNDPPRIVQVLDLVAGGLACAALWWRRRWPIELAVITGLLSVVVSAGGGAAVIMLFTVAVHRRFVIACVVATLHLAAALTFYVVYPDPGMSWRTSAAFAVAFTVAITLWGMFVRARRQLVLSLRERARQAEAEAELRVEQARHLERERIAREMHDVLAHRISLLSVHAGALEYRPDAPREDIARAAAIIRASAHEALQDLRQVIGVLRAPSSNDDHPDPPQPTLDHVAALIEESRQAGMTLTVDDNRPDDAKPPPAVARCAYRVIQEGLTNARKHARGTSVDVKIDGRPGSGLVVEVRNPLPADDSARSDIPGAGAGLVGLAERVGLVGGRFEHGRTPDGHFRVYASLPWPSRP